ncbi:MULTISPECIES: glycosyltransferase [unclassified Sinorhizobium]|uniref:glycosyltransferase n=1 Tax=unclassified Sinorhizobium TaxID=2613772 RepID=UPI0035252DB9
MTLRAERLNIGIELIDDPNWMGGILYLRNLAVTLTRLTGSERPQVHLLGAAQAIERLLGESDNRRLFEKRRSGLAGRLMRRLRLKRDEESRIDVIYPGFGAKAEGATIVSWIPDFQHRHLPHLFSAEELAARDRSIEAIATKPGIVVVSSDVAAEDFSRFFPGHRATVKVWHFRSLIDTTQPASRATIDKHGLPSKYLYLPNQFWTHKNHITALKALARLRDEHGMTIPLVCTGAQSDRRNESHFASLTKFIADAGLANQVYLLGLIDRKEQVDIFRHAAAIVQPSLFEGWSTVVEDARAIGRPIFLSDIPVHREQNPGAGTTYFTPLSDGELARQLAEAWPSLTAGPDPEAESRAQSEMNQLIVSAGWTFVGIMHKAIELRRVS